MVPLHGSTAFGLYANGYSSRNAAREQVDAMAMYWWKWDEQNDRPVFRNDPRGDKGFRIRSRV